MISDHTLKVINIIYIMHTYNNIIIKLDIVHVKISVVVTYRAISLRMYVYMKEDYVFCNDIKNSFQIKYVFNPTNSPHPYLETIRTRC